MPMLPFALTRFSGEADSPARIDKRTRHNDARTESSDNGETSTCAHRQARMRLVPVRGF